MFPGAPIDSGEGSCGLVQDISSSLGFQGLPSFLELGYLQTSPPCGTQARICPLSGLAITTEKHEGGEHTLKELILAPGHVKAQRLLRGHRRYTGLQGM